MREIDASDGGGQLLRTSLALAALTETPVQLTGIRGSRPNPGLKPQHKAAVDVIADATDATVEGVALDSESLTFDPKSTPEGHVGIDIGTAGSITLLFDTLFPLAVGLSEPFAVSVTGGTEVKWSPPLSTYTRVKLPLCRAFGLQAAIERHRTGFYPAGGGRATMYLSPSSLSPIRLTERGTLEGIRLYSRESHHLADQSVAKRQAGTARSELEALDLPVVEESVTTADTDSPGSALAIVLEYEHTRAGFDALGERGKPAEEVATDAVESARQFHEGTAAVDRHIADQLLVFLALAGGEVLIPEMTDHVETSIELLETFGFDLVARLDEGTDCFLVSAE